MLPKSLIDEWLEGLSRIAKSERLSQELTLAEGCYECCFWYVLCGNLDLTVYLGDVDLHKHPHAV